MTSTTASEPWLPCPSCSAKLPFRGEPDFARAFGGEGETCTSCGTRFELWAAVFRGLVDDFALPRAYAAIGAQHTWFGFQLAPFQVKDLVFAEMGVPPSAAIVSIAYTPMGQAAVPVELHGHGPERLTRKQGVCVYGRPREGVEAAEAASPVEVWCRITWVDPPFTDDGWSHLLNAYRAFGDGERRNAVISANIAAESAITKAVYEGLARHASEADTTDLLANGASYAHQLRVLLPLLGKLEQIPTLNARAIAELGRLRELRNGLAHGGGATANVEREEAARLIVAATFAFQYGRFFRRALASRSPA